MSNRYDSQTTTFSPQGHLYQVEYAINATKESGPSLGILGKDCVMVIGAKKETNNKLVDMGSGTRAEKIFEIDDHVCVSVAGMTSDGNVLVQKLRHIAQHYTYRYGSPIPIEQLVVALCDIKQNYTQHGGQRPFGVSFLFCGYDPHFGFQIYQSDPSGSLEGWKAHSIGSWDNPLTNSTLKQDFEENMELEEVKKLCGKVVVKNVVTNTPDGDKYEMAIIQKDASSGKVVFSRVGTEEVGRILRLATEKYNAEGGGNDL